MSNSLVQKIVFAGQSAELPVFLQRKVQSTNIITLILLFVIAIPFTGISLFFFPSLAIYPAIGALVCVGVWIANLLGGIYYSRVIIALLPVMLGALYNASLSGPADGPIPSIYLIELSFALIPFVIFDLKERGFLIFTTLVCIAVIVTFPITKHWLHSNADSTTLREGWLSYVIVVLAIVCELACVFGLAKLNKQSEETSESLIVEMDKKNADLQESAAGMQENLRKLEAAQQAEQKRSWATEGISRISETIRTSQNAAEMYDKIISQIVQYARANQGGLYVVHKKSETNPETTIKLTACYAYNRKKYINQSYKPGEGLLGQAYLEQEYIFMTDIPRDYIRITSGLGDAAPNSLLIMPMKVNDEVEGLLEIASFHKFEPHEIEFFERLGETIASSIQHQRINEHTRYLLENTMSQAEEMRAQEEEMRQNMEELASTQEEMQRKEMEYIRKIQELEAQLATADNNAVPA